MEVMRDRRVRDVSAVGAFLMLVIAALGCSGRPYPPPSETRREPVTDVLHGVEFVDDYRWLEQQDTRETRAWIASQNRYAEVIVGQSALRDRVRSRLTELLDVDDIGTSRRAGDYEYFPIRRRGEEAARLYRRPVSDPNTVSDEQDESQPPTADGDYEVVLDPADIDPTYRTTVSRTDFSDDGRLMLYSVRQGGADEIEVQIRDVV